MERIKQIKGLEEGKIYHVVVGNEDNPASMQEVKNVEEILCEQLPEIKWIVTTHLIEIKGAKEEDKE
jgi:hypothetical protein